MQSSYNAARTTWSEAIFRTFSCKIGHLRGNLIAQLKALFVWHARIGSLKGVLVTGAAYTTESLAIWQHTWINQILTVNRGLKCQDFVPVKAQLYQVFVTYNQQSSGELRVGTSVQCVMVKRTWNPNCTALVKCFYYRNVQHRQTKLKGEAEAESEY